MIVVWCQQSKEMHENLVLYFSAVARKQGGHRQFSVSIFWTARPVATWKDKKLISNTVKTYNDAKRNPFLIAYVQYVPILYPVLYNHRSWRVYKAIRVKNPNEIYDY
jgi:hypothetical protein